MLNEFICEQCKMQFQQETETFEKNPCCPPCKSNKVFLLIGKNDRIK